MNSLIEKFALMISGIFIAALAYGYILQNLHFYSIQKDIADIQISVQDLQTRCTFIEKKNKI